MGFGHYQSSCANGRIVSMREVVEACDELLEEKERLGGTFVFDESNEIEEEEDRYQPPSYDTALVIHSLQT